MSLNSHPNSASAQWSQYPFCLSAYIFITGQFLNEKTNQIGQFLNEENKPNAYLSSQLLCLIWILTLQILVASKFVQKFFIKKQNPGYRTVLSRRLFQTSLSVFSGNLTPQTHRLLLLFFTFSNSGTVLNTFQWCHNKKNHKVCTHGPCVNSSKCGSSHGSQLHISFPPGAILQPCPAEFRSGTAYAPGRDILIKGMCVIFTEKLYKVTWDSPCVRCLCQKRGRVRRDCALREGQHTRLWGATSSLTLVNISLRNKTPVFVIREILHVL